MLKEFFIKLVNLKNYVEICCKKNKLKIWYFDVVLCFIVNEDFGLLYFGLWDKILKVWRLLDLKCLELIEVYDDVVNMVVVGFDDLVFIGLVDGMLKVWKCEF